MEKIRASKEQETNLKVAYTRKTAGIQNDPLGEFTV